MTCHICGGPMELVGPFGQLECTTCYGVRYSVCDDDDDLSLEEAEVFELVKENKR